MGIPTGAVRQALQKEGMDPNIIDMDPEKSYASQVKEEDVDMDTDPPLKEEYAKFFKVSFNDLPCLCRPKSCLQTLSIYSTPTLSTRCSRYAP